MDKKEIRIKKIREAIENGQFFYAEFYADGSGVSCEYMDNTGNHGLPCRVYSSLSIEDAIKVFSGYRLTIHSNKHCF